MNKFLDRLAIAISAVATILVVAIAVYYFVDIIKLLSPSVFIAIAVWVVCMVAGNRVFEMDSHDIHQALTFRNKKKTTKGDRKWPNY